MKAQREIIKKALERGERLTSKEALDHYGVARLSARIHELQGELSISRGWRTVPTRLGSDTRVREYWV